MPLLEHSLLSPSCIPVVSKLLSQLIATLREIQGSLTPSLVSYTFFPLSSILRRNTSANIPDQVLEKLLTVLGILCERWWWDCELAIWDQIIMLCGAVVGGLEGRGKGKDRDDETKEAAAQCLWSLLREHSAEETPPGELMPLAESRFTQLQAHSHTSKIIPVIGETLNSLLATVGSRHRPLQRISLQLLRLLIASYAPGYLVPTVLPGIVSAMTKLALGTAGGKGWVSGEIVAGALQVMEETIVRSVGDEVCIQEGAVQSVVTLEDLAGFADIISILPESSESRPFATARTTSWLRGTSSQLHIAINTLTTLVSHPTPVALTALTKFSASLVATTSLTLPQTQPLLLSFLLSLSNSDYLSISSGARGSLIQLLSSTSGVRHSLLQTMITITKDNLAALPRIIPSQADTKIEHTAGQIEAVCKLAVTHEISKPTGLSTISGGIGKLLGPSGGIEKWGWSLLTVLEFENPPVTIARASAAQLMLENDPEASETVSFPEVTLKNVSSRTAYAAIARMFRSLGHAGGESCLFAVEWFVDVAKGGRGTRAVAALWCASRLLEGIAEVSLDPADIVHIAHRGKNKRLEKFARGLVRNIAEMWDETVEDQYPTDSAEDGRGEDDSRLPTELRTGIVSIRATLDIKQPTTPQRRRLILQPMLHKSLALQLLSIAAGILHARFTPLLIHALYPILHSLVSPFVHLSSTALAALNFVTNSTSYASPANLLLSNFDYALDAVSRHLTRRWLDIAATKVLVVLVRLVGSDVVEKAGDVVEECFDRLDEFHGYEIIVEGLVEVLGEVIKVVGTEEKVERQAQHAMHTQTSRSDGDPKSDSFCKWFAHRNENYTDEQDDADYGPVPHRAWGQEDGTETTANEPEEEAPTQGSDPNADPPPTPTQDLTKQIVSRSLYFLTHGSPVIRARILTLLSSSVPVLPESALLPSIHHAWPFILNRLVDSEPFVVSASAGLVESLATHVGSFMSRRIWDDVWPRFRAILWKLDIADSKNALSRRGIGAVGTDSAYTHSHRLYRSLMKTMTAVAHGVHIQDASIWQVLVGFRRFLHSQAHGELQASAKELYIAIGRNNDDAVWLALSSTSGKTGPKMAFMTESKWDIDTNVVSILQMMAESK